MERAGWRVHLNRFSFHRNCYHTNVLSLHRYPPLSAAVGRGAARAETFMAFFEFRRADEGKGPAPGKQGRCHRAHRGFEGRGPRVHETFWRNRHGARLQSAGRGWRRGPDYSLERGNRTCENERSRADLERLGAGMAGEYAGERGPIREA